MAVLEKSQLAGRVSALLSSPVRETGLEKSRADRLDLVFDGIVGDCHSGRGCLSDSRMLHIPPQRPCAHA